MEEDRIAAMYYKLLGLQLSDGWHALLPRSLRRSSWLPVLVIGLLVLIPALAWHLHREGRFHTVKNELARQVDNSTSADLQSHRPGGLDPLILRRVMTPQATRPEFLSATFLPGLGMGLLQITAAVPRGGEMSLLAAPAPESLAQGTAGSVSGANDNHGSFEVPWAGSLMGITTPVGTSITAVWRGLPVDESTEGSAIPDTAEATSLATQAPDAVKTTSLPGGQRADALFRGVNSDGRWFSQTEVEIATELTAHAIEIEIRAKNSGGQPEPLGIGWHPRFDTAAAARNKVELLLPAGQVIEIADKAKGLPSGRLVAPDTTIERLQAAPAALTSTSFDTTLTSLKAVPGAPGPAAEMLFPDAGYGLRLTALTSSIRAVRITSPAGAGYISIGMSTNLDDPMGREWLGEQASGLVTLEPAQSLSWKLRLEIFAVDKSAR